MQRGGVLRTAGTILASILLFCQPAAIRADGFLPSQPYNYLHAPAGLAGKNKPPAGVIRSFPLHGGRLAQSFVVFTGDEQAGLGANPGTIRSSARTRAVQVTIKAVNPPHAPPAHLRLDGNAYRIGLLGMPGRHAVRVTHLSLALTWPHAPAAVLGYFGGKWHTVCSNGHWQVTTAASVVCSIAAAGTYAAFHH